MTLLFALIIALVVGAAFIAFEICAVNENRQMPENEEESLPKRFLKRVALRLKLVKKVDMDAWLRAVLVGFLSGVCFYLGSYAVIPASMAWMNIVLTVIAVGLMAYCVVVYLTRGKCFVQVVAMAVAIFIIAFAVARPALLRCDVLFVKTITGVMAWASITWNIVLPLMFLAIGALVVNYFFFRRDMALPYDDMSPEETEEAENASRLWGLAAWFIKACLIVGILLGTFFNRGWLDLFASEDNQPANKTTLEYTTPAPTQEAPTPTEKPEEKLTVTENEVTTFTEEQLTKVFGEVRNFRDASTLAKMEERRKATGFYDAVSFDVKDVIEEILSNPIYLSGVDQCLREVGLVGQSAWAKEFEKSFEPVSTEWWSKWIERADDGTWKVTREYHLIACRYACIFVGFEANGLVQPANVTVKKHWGLDPEMEVCILSETNEKYPFYSYKAIYKDGKEIEIGINKLDGRWAIIISAKPKPTSTPKPTTTPKPTKKPDPTPKPTKKPTQQPTKEPTQQPAQDPTTAPTQESQAPTNDAKIIYGDVNGDGKVDVTDLSQMAINLVDKKPFTAEQLKRSDVDGDGIVTLTDLATIRQFVSKKIDKLGPQ